MNDFYKFRGIPIKPVTREGYKEMESLGFGFSDALAVLEEGYNCGGKRRKDILERCTTRNGKTIKVVVEKIISKSGIPYWRIRHVGILTKR